MAATVPIGKAGFAGTMEAAGIEPANDSDRLEINEGDLCEWCACGDPAVAFLVGIRLRVCEWSARSRLKPIVVKKAPPRPGFIYFIQAGENGPVKIGWSVNPFGRLAFFQTGHWETLRIVHEFPGTVPEERALHSRFAAYRIRNEWFEPAVLAAPGIWDQSSRWTVC